MEDPRRTENASTSSGETSAIVFPLTPSSLTSCQMGKVGHFLHLNGAYFRGGEALAVLSEVTERISNASRRFNDLHNDGPGRLLAHCMYNRHYN